MNIPCPACGKIVGTEDRRKSKTGLPTVLLNGSSLLERQNEAPRIKCGHCRKTVILLKASQL